jgi:hypothetical protein
MDEPEPNQFSIWKAAVFWFGILAFLLYLGISNVAIKADINGELITHPICTVLDKKASVSGGENYSVTTTCGSFPTNRQTYGYVETGMIYDLKTTKGNWAHKPFLMLAITQQPPVQ